MKAFIVILAICLTQAFLEANAQHGLVEKCVIDGKTDDAKAGISNEAGSQRENQCREACVHTAPGYLPANEDAVSYSQKLLNAYFRCVKKGKDESNRCDHLICQLEEYSLLTA